VATPRSPGLAKGNRDLLDRSANLIVPLRDDPASDRLATAGFRAVFTARFAPRTFCSVRTTSPPPAPLSVEHVPGSPKP
jgi:hypothetical protein